MVKQPKKGASIARSPRADVTIPPSSLATPSRSGRDRLGAGWGDSKLWINSLRNRRDAIAEAQLP